VDYAYAGLFFSLPFDRPGVLMIAGVTVKETERQTAIVASSCLLAAPVLMANQEWTTTTALPSFN